MIQNFGVVLDTLRAIIPYGPIPLYAESLRVHRALVSAILTKTSISECLTGCIKDFTSLWDMDDVEIFNRSSLLRQPFAVTSIRHGNEFDLANSAVLAAANVINRRITLGTRTIQANPTREVSRETIVTVAFVTPGSLVPTGVWRGLAVVVVFAMEVTITCSMSYVMLQHGMYLGTYLLLCVTVTTIISFGLRRAVKPRFGNRMALEKDRLATAKGAAALDIHVVADSWNSCRLSVLCGYSSQLHSLTNIPIRCSRPALLTWACRLLAAVLTTQAALLAAVSNTEGNERWTSLVWIAAYLCLSLLKRVLHAIVGPENILSEQPGAIETSPPLVFSSRRAALVFISLLPVSEKVDRWAWWDVFMPDNARRREYLSTFEMAEAFIISRDWKTKAPHWKNMIVPETKVGPNIPLKEALHVLESQPFRNALKRYLEVMLTGKVFSE